MITFDLKTDVCCNSSEDPYLFALVGKAKISSKMK